MAMLAAVTPTAAELERYMMINDILDLLKVINFFISIASIFIEWQVFRDFYNTPAWHCLIPFYNDYYRFKMTFGNGWYMLIPIVPAFFALMMSELINFDNPFSLSVIIMLILLAFSIFYSMYYRVQRARSLNASKNKRILAAIFPVIGLGIIAFSYKTKYVGVQPHFQSVKNS